MTGRTTVQASASEAAPVCDEPKRVPGATARPLGEIVRALAQAAQAGPGTVRELAQRAQVGRRVATYTASRMVARGQLVLVEGLSPAGRRRWPPVFAAPAGDDGDSKDDAAAADLQKLLASWTAPVRR